MKITKQHWKQIEELSLKHFGMEMMLGDIPKTTDEVDIAIRQFSQQRQEEIDRAEDCMRRDATALMDSWHNETSAGTDASEKTL